MPKSPRKPRKIRTRLLKSTDHLSLLQDLHLVDWSGVFSRPSVHDQWSYVTNRLTAVLDRHAPLRTTCVRNPRAPAVTSATLCLMAERRGVLRREGRTPAFRELDRRVRSAIRRDSRHVARISPGGGGGGGASKGPLPERSKGPFSRFKGPFQSNQGAL